jgi:hypothetical protein
LVPTAGPSDLATVPLFASLSESQLAEVAGWFEAKEVGGGVQLVGEGATGYSFFVIGEGEPLSRFVMGEQLTSVPAISLARSPCWGRCVERRL